MIKYAINIKAAAVTTMDRMKKLYLIFIKENKKKTAQFHLFVSINLLINILIHYILFFHFMCRIFKASSDV